MGSGIQRMPVEAFVAALCAAYQRKDGYIMGATGQDPRDWPEDSHWFTQYTGRQRQKALYWREHARRVWDCNGLAEGIYRDFSGVSIDTQARYNYRQWCDPKGAGLIPPAYRVPGAAVFWGDSASDIHHVAYLVKPVKASDPEGDWYLIEARGVMYGVVRTRLLSRKPDYWGWMTKYFDYPESEETGGGLLGARLLRPGDEGEDVRQLQTDLIRLGYDLGRWGADGDFGDATELAVRAFQRDSALEEDGVVGPKTLAALEKALSALEDPVERPVGVLIEGGNCYVRAEPDRGGAALGVARRGDRLPYAGETSPEGWLRVVWKGRTGWVSGKYGRLSEAG